MAETEFERALSTVCSTFKISRLNAYQLTAIKEFMRGNSLLQLDKTNKQTNLALCNAVPLSSYEPQRNFNEKVAFNTATTTAKRNFQGTTHNILQKGAVTQRHIREQKI